MEKGSKELFFKLSCRHLDEQLTGRYISDTDIAPRLEKLKSFFTVEEIGRSVLEVPIHAVKFGNGPNRIMGWSQMHGNEATTTKGLFDLFNIFLNKEGYEDVDKLLKHFTFLFIPMLNPDGAAIYTRENINKVDLNRDAHNLQEKESKVLRSCYENFQPHYCFNLHDQRTIFGVGGSSKPATLSFLSPSLDEARSISPEREEAMKIIAAMNDALQEKIPGQVGRFDDAFNINCTGDTFQSLGVPTILFECGHYQQDYQREETRKFFVYAVLVALENIASGDHLKYKVADYEQIPQNTKNFNDVVLRQGIINGKIVDVGIQFSEVLEEGEIHFVPKIQSISPQLEVYGHREIHCKEQELLLASKKVPSENDIVSLILLNNEKFLIKP
jgi:hypothetical protein